MWENISFNTLLDREQWRVIQSWLPERRGAVLDVGCGIGRVSSRLAAEFSEYVGFDLEPMVAEARRRNPDLADSFVASTVEDYEFPAERFDFVLSLGCVATACTKEKLVAVAPKIVRSLRSGGRLLFIEPFHKSWILTRGCKMTAREVASLFRDHGMVVEGLDGILFPPLRIVLAEKALQPFPRLTEVGYRASSAIVRLSPAALADYKVISLSKR